MNDALFIVIVAFAIGFSAWLGVVIAFHNARNNKDK